MRNEKSLAVSPASFILFHTGRGAGNRLTPGTTQGGLIALRKNRRSRRAARAVLRSECGLRYGPDHGGSRGPLETKGGSYIYSGAAAAFHDWGFRSMLRIELLESQEEAARAAAIATEVPDEADEGLGMANG